MRLVRCLKTVGKKQQQRTTTTTTTTKIKQTTRTTNQCTYFHLQTSHFCLINMCNRSTLLCFKFELFRVQMIQCCITSTETMRLIRDGRGRSHVGLFFYQWRAEKERLMKCWVVLPHVVHGSVHDVTDTDCRYEMAASTTVFFVTFGHLKKKKKGGGNWLYLKENRSTRKCMWTIKTPIPYLRKEKEKWEEVM